MCWEREVTGGLTVLTLFWGEPRIATFTLALLPAGSPEVDQGKESQLHLKSGEGLTGAESLVPPLLAQPSLGT